MTREFTEHEKEALELFNISVDDVIFFMDGQPHAKGCCDRVGKKCECGGWMHYQPVYGGYFYKCEKCSKEVS